MSQVSESRFNMWRVVFAVAHSDGEFQQEEKDFLIKYLETVTFSDTQQEQLKKEMNHPPKVEEALSGVTAPADRSMCIYFARLLLWSDGILQASEEEILKKLQAANMKQVDLDGLKGQISSIEESIEIDQPKGLRGAFEAFIEKLGIAG